MKYWEFSSAGSEHLPYKQRVTGSNPVTPTNRSHIAVAFFMAHVYILYSHCLEQYYIGSTDDILKERLRRHLTNHKGFTSKTKDWIIAYSEQYQDSNEARQREIQIKNWKSKKMIEKLISQN
jgi:putative endonuclease